MNLFHGRVDAGVAKIGNAEIRAEQQRDLPDADKKFVAYSRPHEIELHRHQHSTSSIGALIKHIRAAGPLVSLELERVDNAQPVYVELSRERFGKLDLKKGEQVFLELRNYRVFEEDKVPEYYI